MNITLTVTLKDTQIREFKRVVKTHFNIILNDNHVEQMLKDNSLLLNATIHGFLESYFVIETFKRSILQTLLGWDTKWPDRSFSPEKAASWYTDYAKRLADNDITFTKK